MTMPFTLYKRPNGRSEELEMSKIRPEDEAWFKENNIKLSAEDIGMSFCFYADYGAKEEDDETPKEFVYIVPSTQSCEDAMAHIRAKIIELRGE